MMVERNGNGNGISWRIVGRTAVGVLLGIMSFFCLQLYEHVVTDNTSMAVMGQRINELERRVSRLEGKHESASPQ